MDELDEETAAHLARSPHFISAAKAVIDRAFKAQENVTMQEELAHLQENVKTSRDMKRALPDPALAADKLAEVRVAAENEQTEACRLRMAWMAEIGNSPAAISAYLRYNRPQSVAEEQENLDVVRKQLEWERNCEGAMRTGTQHDEMGMGGNRVQGQEGRDERPQPPTVQVDDPRLPQVGSIGQALSTKIAPSTHTGFATSGARFGLTGFGSTGSNRTAGNSCTALRSDCSHCVWIALRSGSSGPNRR